eukprot:Skav233757  [mRNA]  locus=scaffold1792:386573:387022:+ [translate_table: standard]
MCVWVKIKTNLQCMGWHQPPEVLNFPGLVLEPRESSTAGRNRWCHHPNGIDQQVVAQTLLVEQDELFHIKGNVSVEQGHGQH